MWAAAYLRSPVSQSSLSHLRPPLCSRFLRPPSSRKADAERAGKCGKETEQEETAQDGGGGGGGGKRKKAMYSAFVLIIPPRLGDIQAASVPSAGVLLGGLSAGPPGERL